MFKARKHGREKIFEQAMLARKERSRRRRTVPGEAGSLPRVSASLWTAFALVGGYILFFSPALMVQRVSIEGESVIPIREYEDSVRISLEGAYFGLIKKRNYFLVPTEEIADRVLERYPLLSEVTVKRQFPDGLKLVLREAPVILRWCSGGPCYGLRDGVAIPLPYSEDERYTSSRLSVIDESALPVQAGALLPVEPYLETFRILSDGLTRLTIGQVTTNAVTPSRHSNELSLSVTEGWRLLVAVNRPAEESLGTLQIFLEEYRKDHLDRSKLAWVDLRVEGKVFYAESGQPVEEMPSAVDSSVAPSDKEDTKKKKKSD